MFSNRISFAKLQFAFAMIGIGCGSDDGGGMNAMAVAGTFAPQAGTGVPVAGQTPVGVAGTGGRGAAGSSVGAAGRAPIGAAGSGAAGTGAAIAGSSGTMAAAGASGMATSGAGGMDASGAAGAMAGTGAGAAGTGGTAGAAGAAPMGMGMCCDDGDCICREPPPNALTGARGRYQTRSYDLAGAGCIYYPTDAEPPFAAVAISDGYLGSGGCGAAQTSGWGPLYASHGIVAMIVHTTGSDQPATRGRKLTNGIAAFKSENMKSGSPLYQKLAGRYGTSGFSMGGGGTSYSSQGDKTLKTSVAIMPWGPVTRGIEVPTLVICGSSDTVAPCSSHGTPLYSGIPDSVPKMRVTVSSGHNGQPSAGGNDSGKYGLAFQKVFLEGDTRWRPLLVGANATASNIK